MIKSKRLKNNVLFSALVFGFLVLLFAVAYLLPNQFAFKFFDYLAIQAEASGKYKKSDELFIKAGEKYISWDLAAKSNRLGILYQKKQYELLAQELSKVKNKYCRTDEDVKSISVFCENIFYLDGLDQYRLGEKKDIGKKEEKTEKIKLFTKAVESFQKTLAVNPDNIWAKENIDFILNKQKKQENKERGGDKNKQKNNAQDRDNIENGQKKTGSKKQQDKKYGSNNAEKKEGRADKRKISTSQKSKLPEEVRQAIEQRQKELEQQQKNQKGFSRSKSKAQKQKEQMRDPFNMFKNDPFFQDFFGDDPFSRPNLHKEITSPNEKDW